MKIQIENLIAQMQGRDLNIYQRADALKEFNKLIDYVYSLEQIISERQKSTETSEHHGTKALHIADVSNSLAAFMLWYKKNVPIGTQKSSEEIVSDYLSNL